MNTPKEYLEQADKDRFEYLSKVMKAARASGSLREVEYWHQKIEEFHDHVESRTNESSEDEGWIAWKGSRDGNDCPVEEGTLVDVKYRDGEVRYNLNALGPSSPGRDATHAYWANDDVGNDIVAYRLSK